MSGCSVSWRWHGCSSNCSSWSLPPRFIACLKLRKLRLRCWTSCTQHHAHSIMYPQYKGECTPLHMHASPPADMHTSSCMHAAIPHSHTRPEARSARSPPAAASRSWFFFSFARDAWAHSAPTPKPQHSPPLRAPAKHAPVQHAPAQHADPWAVAAPSPCIMPKLLHAQARANASACPHASVRPGHM